MNRSRLAEIAFVLLRVVVGFLFMHHGGQKLFGWFGGIPGGTPVLTSQTGIAGILEFFGGLLILVGLFTGVVAFILSGEMAVAYFQGHQPHGTFPIENHGEPAVLFCFLYLYFAAHGAGLLSLDSLFRKRNRPPA